MKSPVFIAGGLAALALPALLSGCSGSASPGGAPALPATTADRHQGSSQPHLRWISPDAAKQRNLLFVTDPGSEQVFIFSADLQLKGAITGFNTPKGACADKSGNVWIVDWERAVIYEFSHTGQSLGKISGVTGFPTGCAVDPTTGNLAVTTNPGSASPGPGELMLYPKATGSPTAITDPIVFTYSFAAYDAAGNLYFDGTDGNGNFTLDKVPTGSTTAQSIQLVNGAIYQPGMVQSNPKGVNELLITDMKCNDAQTPTTCLDRVGLIISGYPFAEIIGQVPLKNQSGASVCQMEQGAYLPPKTFAGPDNEVPCNGSGFSGVGRWAFPAGGSEQFSNYTEGDFTAPFAATWSVIK
ncbi:MAG: hypothetical protein JOZ77_12265 [Candidatus Eremiobacteraeota bacterium]|nr:hypothetical protein [Candidatus Eremiobacteraeota bacterium]